MLLDALALYVISDSTTFTLETFIAVALGPTTISRVPSRKDNGKSSMGLPDQGSTIPCGIGLKLEIQRTKFSN